MSYIDGSLIEKAKAGDWESITALCHYLAECKKAGVVADIGATELLYGILERIGDGEAPNIAFGWKQSRRGRRTQNSAYQQWDIRVTVQNRMKDGESWTSACFAVSSDATSSDGKKTGEFLRTHKSIEKICAGLTVDTDLSSLDGIFPLGYGYNSHRRSA